MWKVSLYFEDKDEAIEFMSKTIENYGGMMEIQEVE